MILWFLPVDRPEYSFWLKYRNLCFNSQEFWYFFLNVKTRPNFLRWSVKWEALFVLSQFRVRHRLFGIRLPNMEDERHVNMSFAKDTSFIADTNNQMWNYFIPFRFRNLSGITPK